MADLRVWAAAACSAASWLPIPDETQLPPLGALEFTSDAAGGTGNQDWAGVASIGHWPSGEPWFLCRGEWPPSIMTEKDEKGAEFKSKMTTLELVGLMLPFLTIPHIVRGRHIILGVDNVSVVHAWENKSVKGDLTASVLVRALMVIAAFLECRVYTRHVTRLSTEASQLADSLTRDTTATEAVWARVQGAVKLDPPQALWDWLGDLSTDWQLGFKLVDNLKNT